MSKLEEKIIKWYEVRLILSILIGSFKKRALARVKLIIVYILRNVLILFFPFVIIQWIKYGELFVIKRKKNIMLIQMN